MRALIYLRVSTKHQDTIEEQKNTCLNFAYTRGITAIKVYKDIAVSGITPIEKRAGLTDALTNLKKGDLFIVASRDRLARDIGLAIQIDCIIQAIGAQLISVAHESHWNDNPIELRKRRIVDIDAEVFRETVRHKTNKALRNKRKKNERIGTIPFGYKLAYDGKTLEPCDREQTIIQKAHRLKTKRYALKDIAYMLTEQGYHSRTGNQLQASHISNILRHKAPIPHAMSRTRYGYKKSPQAVLEVDKEEQAIIVLIKRLKQEGMNLRALAEYLSAHGYCNRAGNAFHHTQVWRILQSKTTFIPAQVCHDQDLVTLIKSLRGQGYTLRKIVMHVNAQGYTGTTGNPLHLTQVARIING